MQARCSSTYSRRAGRASATSAASTTSPCSTATDAMAAGVAAQAAAFAERVRGGDGEVPGAAASARATRIGLAVIDAARTGEAVGVGT